MTLSKDKGKHEPWEEEVLAMHRWGRLSYWFKITDDRGKKEHAQLKNLWKRARPLNKSTKKIVDQIRSIEICNWNLEESILELCRAIGTKKPATLPIGHMASITKTRWKKIWAYCLTLRNWLPCEAPNGYDVLLEECDPLGKTQKHVLTMLGNRTRLKELYVERFCLCLEFWLSGYPAKASARYMAQNAAVTCIDEEIKKLDPESKILQKVVLKSEGDGRLNPCNHKAFYRYDLIISSIGAGKWRGAMGRRLIDGRKRANLLGKYLSPIESWLQGNTKQRKGRATKLSRKIHRLLGKPDNVKIFLASLLIALLRPQQLAAKKLAKMRADR